MKRAALRMEAATLLGRLCWTGWDHFLREIEKQSHLGKRAERTGRRRGILRLLTESGASAALIRCGDWGKDRGSLSEQTEAQGAVCESSTERETELERSGDEPCTHLFTIRSPPASAESCSLCCECCSAGHLFVFFFLLFFFLLGKPKNPREMWITGTSVEHCGTLTQAKECSRTVGPGSLRIILPDSGPLLIHQLQHPLLSSSCVHLSLLLFMGGEAVAGWQSACGGMNGQPSAHNMLWMSGDPHRTNERLQARLVRLSRLWTLNHNLFLYCSFKEC